MTAYQFVHFGKCINYNNGEYGNAIISKNTPVQTISKLIDLYEKEQRGWSLLKFNLEGSLE